MLLHTPTYLVFLVGVLGLYWLLPSGRWRKAWLLGASYLFCSSFDVRFTALLVGLTVTVYYLSRAIPHSPRAKFYTWLSVGLSLGVLGIFKYANFFLGSVQSVLQAGGLTVIPPAVNLLLPVGISFYTFQSISYTLEIYRQRAEPASSLIDFALYLAFFPKLLAGPFVRPADFLRQLAEPAAPLKQEVIFSALGLLLLGLVKKILIADSLSVLAEVSFQAAGRSPGPVLFPTPLYWRGFYLYAFQIYADFSGYTDIARASALLLGFALPENFQQPYLSATPTDFWNRWHMTLTQWFREYVFFPLSRRLSTLAQRKYSRVIQVTTTLLTMTLIGFWHGAAWTYIVWGLWHGLWLSLDRWLNLRPTRRWQMITLAVLNFHVIGIGWVFFGASSLAAAGRFLVGLARFEQLHWLPLYLPPVLLSGLLVLGIDWAARGRWPTTSPAWRFWQPVWVTTGFVIVVSLMLLGLLSSGPTRPFIYGLF
jgi:alginate O-acetyltransferase complex protein AlgI